MVKGVILLGILSITVGLGFVGFLKPAQAGAIDPQTAQDMLDVTVSIQLLAPNPAKPGRWLMARGTGTLVAHAGRNLIITHDHWGELLEWATVVRFLDAANEPLIELGGAAFRSLIRYQDGGTMLLAVPEGLIPDELTPASERRGRPALTTAELGDGRLVTAGDTVTVSYHNPQQENRLSVFEATVESVESGATSPVLILRSVDGQVVIPGDSGGGVWVDGKLVGNLWSRVLVQNKAGETLEAPSLFMAATQPMVIAD